MKVTIDKASHLPEKIWYKDTADASLTLTMKKVELDPRIPDKVFDKAAIFPKGVEYIDKRNAQ
jgi:outer membrane lipoprotein-sorting protein